PTSAHLRSKAAAAMSMNAPSAGTRSGKTYRTCSIDGNMPGSRSWPMMDAEWMESNDPYKLLRALPSGISERRLRLFACSCWRIAWHHLSNPRSCEAIESAERFADGQDGNLR